MIALIIEAFFNVDYNLSNVWVKISTGTFYC